MTTPNPPDKAGAAAPSPALLDHGTILSIMSGIMLAMFLSALEQTIVSPALPTIGRSLGDVETLSWVVSAYLLTYTAATPLFGKLSDIYGRRLMLLTSLAIFIVGSAACALAPNMPALIVARALQATGGNRTAAAELLGLSRQSLYAKLGRYGLEEFLEVKTVQMRVARGRSLWVDNG